MGVLALLKTIGNIIFQIIPLCTNEMADASEGATSSSELIQESAMKESAIKQHENQKSITQEDIPHNLDLSQNSIENISNENSKDTQINAHISVAVSSDKSDNEPQIVASEQGQLD